MSSVSPDPTHPDDTLVEYETLRWWKTCPWWPVGRSYKIHVGVAGHDRELVLNIDDYDYHEPIPSLVVGALRALLPVTWKVESRGSRIECHPSGQFAGGFQPGDADILDAAAAAVMAAPTGGAGNDGRESVARDLDDDEAPPAESSE
jgi:hypothetical protein